MKARGAEAVRPPHQALDLVGDAVVAVDTEGLISYLNSAARRLLGPDGRHAVGRPVDTVLRLEPDRVGAHLNGAAGMPCLERFHADARPMVLIKRDRRQPVDVLDVAAPADADAARLLVLHDRGPEFELRSSIAEQARTDKLTGLLNRHELDRCLGNLIEDAETAGRSHALLYIDLDQFKVINDTCGHMAGDELLRVLGMSLAKVVQRGDIIGRLGGDEFGVLLCNVAARESLEVANRICKAVESIRFAWGSYSFAVRASIGVTIIDEYTRTSEVAMRQVDAACYAAKEAGRNRVHLFTENDRQLARRQGEMQWLSRINQALDENRLRIVQQRIVPLQNGVSGEMAEVLLRIESPDGGMISPGAFIPAAERYNLMPLLDRWVINRLLMTLARHPQASDPFERYTINLSGLSLGDPAFLQYILDEFDRSGVNPARICFEITETAAVASFSTAVRFMSLLREIGCRFALDDFGSGMSSFGYLRELPVDYLKIDGMFVTDLDVDPFHRAIVKSITEVDHAAGMLTIAEHVNSEASLKLLREMGVDYVQGYFIERPVPFGLAQVA